MKKIAILLSAYNGGEYIENQLKSIYGQVYNNIDVYVRDDGSEADFVETLRKLSQQYGFELIEGHNLGFVGSFMELLERVDDADLYSFADQDDIWLPEKLSQAVEWFDANGNEHIPQLYHGAYEVISDNRQSDRFYYSEKGYGFRRSITENHYSGFAMVINRKLREYMLRGNYDKIGYHDWWAGMIAKALGEAYSDNRIIAKHISHGDNLTTFNLGTRLRWLRDNLINESDIHKRCIEFKSCFDKELSDDNRKTLDMFCGERYNLLTSIKKSIYPARWRPVWSSEIVIRMLMLVGRV